MYLFLVTIIYCVITQVLNIGYGPAIGIYLIALGLVKVIKIADTTIKTIICTYIFNPNKCASNATNAPPANQIAVNPTVAISTTTKIIINASQKMFSIH